MARQTSRRRSAPRYIATRGPSFLPFKSPSERGTNSEGMTWDEWRTAVGTGGLTTKKLLDAWQASEDPAEHRPARLRSNRRGSRRLVSLFKNSRRRTSLRRNSTHGRVKKLSPYAVTVASRHGKPLGWGVGDTQDLLVRTFGGEKSPRSGDRDEIQIWVGKNREFIVTANTMNGTISLLSVGNDSPPVPQTMIKKALSIGEVRPNSRRRGSLRRNSYTSTPAGKKVVMAFLERRPADSAKLTTDGKRLDGTWMGGRGIAEWVGDKIVFHDLGSKSAQTVQKLIRREAPANWLKPNRRRGSMRRNSGTVLEEAQELAERINKDGVGLPFTRAQVSTLGGAHRPSVSVALSFDPRGEWSNGIFENSRYARLMYHFDERSFALISGYKVGKMRKTRFVSVDDAYNKLVKWVKANQLNSNRRRGSMRRNSSLVKKGADASALALMERAERAVAAGDTGVASATFEHLDRWKERHGKWPFEAKRYWYAVNRTLALSRNGRRRSRGMRRNPPIEFDAETRALAQRVYGRK